MTEQTGQNLEKREQHSNVRYLIHSDESTTEGIIAGSIDGNGVRNHVARHAFAGQTIFQASGGARSATQSNIMEPAKGAAAGNQTHDGNESLSSGPGPITPRISRLFLDRMSPREKRVNGHRKTQSESIARHKATINFESGQQLRRNRSVVDAPSLGVKKQQQIDQESAVKNTPPQEPERTSEPIQTLVFDPSRLDHQLITALKYDSSTGGKFVPKGDLDRLVTQELLVRELSRKEYLAKKILRRPWLSSNKYVRVEPLIDYEHTRYGQVGSIGGTTTQLEGLCYQKIFAILMFIGRQSKLRAFVRERVCDSDLPLESKNFELRRRDSFQPALKCLKEVSDIEQFLTNQWRVLARGFHKTDGQIHPHFKAALDEVLPFTLWEDTGRQGASGKVYKAEIHQDHHNFDKREVPNNVVAVKKIRSVNPEAFHELRVLRNLGKKRHVHNHLLPLVAIYEQHDFLHLILPWAEADLRQYWETKDPKSFDEDTELSTWMKQQCCGLAEAVSQIHRYKTTSDTTMLSNNTSLRRKVESTRFFKVLFGRHGDIKPANILWFPDKSSEKCLGTLKLSDFGTARFTVEERTPIQHGYTIPYSRPYRSPECQLPGGEASSQCDVWALGCIFLEFVCWYIGGYELLRKFESERFYAGHFEGLSFFFFKPGDDTQCDTIGLKAPVIKMMENLHESLKVENASNGPLRDILHAVEDGMLVVLYNGADGGNRLDGTDNPTSFDLLRVQQPTHRRRKSAGNIARDLGSILESPKEEVREVSW